MKYLFRKKISVLVLQEVRHRFCALLRVGEKNVGFGFAQQLINSPARDFRRRGIDERRPVLQVKTTNAFSRGIQDEFVAPLQLLQFLRAQLNVHFQHVLGAFELLGLLRQRSFHLLALIELALKRRLRPGNVAEPHFKFRLVLPALLLDQFGIDKLGVKFLRPLFQVPVRFSEVLDPSAPQ